MTPGIGPLEGAPRSESTRKVTASGYPRVTDIPAATSVNALPNRSGAGRLSIDISIRYIGAALLELAILGLLKEQELHGYELKKRLAETLGQFSGVSFGSLYP